MMNDEELADLRRRAEHCTTHHNACDCREFDFAAKIEALQHRAEEVAAELVGMASSLDIDLPSDSGYQDELRQAAQRLRIG